MEHNWSKYSKQCLAWRRCLILFQQIFALLGMQVGEDVGKYDRDIKSWPKYKESKILHNLFDRKIEINYWKEYSIIYILEPSLILGTINGLTLA